MEKELNDEELCNWLKACIALKYFKEGIMPFIHQQCENIFIQNVSKVQARCNLSQYICKVCVIDTLKPSHAKNNPCSKRKCNCKIANTILCKDNGSCSELYDLLRDNHRHNEPNFSNTNCSLWSDPTRGPWEQMKCFIFTPGYKYTAHESDADVTSLIQIFENNKELQNVLGICFADFDQVRKDRNAIYHSGNMTMSKADLRCYIYHVKTVLELPMFQNYVSTLYLIAKLTELETNTTRITTQNEIDIREEVMKALKESKKELEMHAEQGRNVADELRRLMDAENANTVKLEKIFGEHIKTLFDQIKETRETIQLERNEFRRDLSATINNIDELRREHGVHYRGIQEILQILQQNDRLPRGIKRKRAEPERHDVVRAVIKVLCSTNKDLVSEKIVKIAKGCTQDDDPQLLSEVASVLEQLQKDGNIIVDIKNECVALYISVPSLQNWIHLCRDFFNGALMQLLQPLQNYLRTLPKCGALELRMNISEHDLIKSFASLLDRISPVLASKTFSDRHDVNVTIELLQELQFKLCVYNRKAKALAESLDEVAKLIEGKL
ncbi:uncharacterized protein LOC127857480 [Dreissena polymorpha]|uniref:Uncharacterized protein n=1 Tax=Dreissena polymorpha TaxID=45954 RepID=A0A9D4HB57_DREPO|nr:uncharacterized protein LOC127857480 [Dreissena polymorpha]KAH3713726.1 hypothetical protein DPMN_073528 [Dreissena polymorpha]